ncbi:MAG: hypothetical protein HY679_11575 [Chloroflexi bacterium]|nr:hypothetical protein [Chloroflexota bacterium]
MSFYSYLARLEDTLRSRRDITVEALRLTLTTLGAVFEANLRFHDGSWLHAVEEIEIAERQGIRRINYSFHYQRADGTLIFRYDNSPHYPNLPTFPDHKHEGDAVREAKALDLADVLREIDALIYPDAAKK